MTRRVLLISLTYNSPVNRPKLPALVRTGAVELGLVAPRWWPGTAGREVAPDPDGHAVFAMRTWLTGRVASFVYAPTVVGALRSFRPEIVHVEHDAYTLAALEMTTLAALTPGSPRRIHFTWENLPAPWLRTPKALRRAIERWVLDHSDGVICGNSAARQRIRELGFRGPSEVIPQVGVDPWVFRSSNGANPRRVLRIGFLGRLVAEKGLDLLVMAVDGLQGAREVVIAGSGPLAGQVAAWARERAWLSYAGPVVPEGVPEFLRRLDVLVLPSRSTPSWAEQFGHVLIEAMACGLAVVGSTCGAIPEVIGDAGLLFEEGDAEGLTEVLQRLVNSPDLVRALGKAGRERVLTHYTHELVADQTLAFYERVMNG